MISARQYRMLLLGALVMASSAAAVLAVRGEWAQFGIFFAGLPAVWKTPGPRRMYLSRWVLPMVGVYAVVLCGSIFLGLRRVRKGAR